MVNYQSVIMHPVTTCAAVHLEIISDEAAFESSRSTVLDGEVPTTKDLVADIHTVSLPEDPGVLVANHRPIRDVCR